MDFNINEVTADMMSAIKGSVTEDWHLVKGTANTFFNARKERLELLASLRLSNEISQEFFNSRINDEKKILESELHALAIITKAAAERAANAAIDVLTKAVSVAMGII